MPDAERRARMQTWIEQFEGLRKKTVDEAHQEFKECQEAARFLFWKFSEEDNWTEVERCLQVFERVSGWLSDESARIECRFLRAGLQARDGNVTEARDALVAFRSKEKTMTRTYETPATYIWMAEQFSIGGDNQQAAYWYEVASETRDRDQITRASAVSANAFFESLLSDRELRGQIRQQEKKILNQRWLAFSLALAGLCLWLAQRTLQQRGRQKELQDRIDEQTDSLRLAKEKAEAQNHAKTEYVARINHEIRNPLTAIVACSELIADRRLSPESLVEIQDTLRLSSENVLRLISDVIDFSHIESGTLVASPSTFSPTELQDSVAAMIRPKLATGVELRCSTSVNLPPLVVADETKIQQVLLNVAQNAARHTITGSLELECQVIRPDTALETTLLRWTIRDTGSGMTPEQVNAAFTQEASQLTGTGLGLYISKSLVDCMQGTIACESEAGRGTTFTVCIPFQDTTIPRVLPEQEPSTDTEGVRSVLVIDDEPANRTVLSKLLKAIGYQCDVADTWPVAESLLMTRKFDVVLLDLRMPKMDGFEVFRRLKELPISDKPRVYAMTGDATESRRQQVAVAGFAGFLAKPFSTAEVSDIINGNSDTVQKSR